MPYAKNATKKIQNTPGVAQKIPKKTEKAPVIQKNSDKTVKDRIYNIQLAILIVAFAVIAVGGVIFLYEYNQIEKEKLGFSGKNNENLHAMFNYQKQIKAQTAEINTLKEDKLKYEQQIAGALTADLKIFASAELGLSFKYPQEWGLAAVNIRNGDTGRIFMGTFSANANLTFGGISTNFSEGRGGAFLDTQGYYYTGDKYYFKFVSDKEPTAYPLLPVKILDVNSEKILIIDKNGFVNEIGIDGPKLGPGDNKLAALANLKSSEFPGVGFWDNDLNSVTQEQLESLLNTIIVSK